ncbi:HAD family hydrolase [Candidatus Bipolaricaulota bacterium]|nr:HAD family hydrolase [Candidatus Bipolaricaulota bacterium]
MIKPALLVFDLDGTLYRTASSFLPTMRRVFEQYGVDGPSDELIMGQVGEPFSAFLDWAIDRGLPRDRDALARTISYAEYASIRERGELFPGVLETLRLFKASGHAIAICTNGDQRYVGVILEKFGIGDLFDAIRTHEDEKKTKTEMIAELRDQWPDRTAFVIGDRYHDVQAGIANGCVVVAAAYGYAKPGELSDADHLIERFGDLAEIVGEST